MLNRSCTCKEKKQLHGHLVWLSRGSSSATFCHSHFPPLCHCASANSLNSSCCSNKLRADTLYVKTIVSSTTEWEMRLKPTGTEIIKQGVCSHPEIPLAQSLGHQPTVVRLLPTLKLKAGVRQRGRGMLFSQ